MNSSRTHHRPVRVAVGALLLAASALALPIAAAPSPADAADVSPQENFQMPPYDSLTQGYCDVFDRTDHVGFFIGFPAGEAAPAGLEYLISTNQPDADLFDVAAIRNEDSVSIEKITDYQFKLTTLGSADHWNAHILADGIRRVNAPTTLTIVGPNASGGTDELTWTWENMPFSCRADLDRIRR